MAIDAALCDVPTRSGCPGARLLRRAAGDGRHRPQRVRRRREILGCGHALVELGVAADDPEVEALVRHDGQAGSCGTARPSTCSSPTTPSTTPPRGTPAGALRRGTIPILSAEHLVVCKVIFNRPRDWVDVEAMVEAQSEVDPAEVLRWVARIAGDEAPATTDRRPPHRPLIVPAALPSIPGPQSAATGSGPLRSMTSG